MYHLLILDDFFEKTRVYNKKIWLIYDLYQTEYFCYENKEEKVPKIDFRVFKGKKFI